MCSYEYDEWNDDELVGSCSLKGVPLKVEDVDDEEAPEEVPKPCRGCTEEPGVAWLKLAEPYRAGRLGILNDES